MDDLRDNYAGNDLRLTGIGGWLAVLGIVIVISILSYLLNFYNVFIPLFKDRTLQEIHNINQSVYNVIIFELIMNGALFIALGLLCFFFFRKSKLFPNLMIGYMVIRFFAVVCDSVLIAQYVAPVSQISAPNIISPLIFLIVWGAYLKKSVRVKNTFVH